LLRWTRKAFYKLKGRGIIGTAQDHYFAIQRWGYGVFLRAPGVRGKVQAEVSEAIGKLQDKLVRKDLTKHLTLPKEGWSEEQVRAELKNLAEMEHTRWEDGYVSGAVYEGKEALIKLQTEAFGMFTVSNPIHPDVFPGVRKMEAEIVAMVCTIQ
jgi:sphinganine-1-phosphate aldolase